MHKLWKRFCAYIVDMLIITLLTQCLSSTTILNPNLNKYQKYTKEYNKLYQSYINFTYQLQKNYEDNKLTEEEYKKLIEKNSSYQDVLKKYYQENTLTQKNYKKLLKETSKTYQDSSSKLYYQIEKNSISEMIIYLIITILYFVGFNYITKGQTLGKKITRLRIVHANNKNQKLKINNYLLRGIPMYQIITYLITLIVILTLKEKQFLSITSIINYIQSILEFAIIATMLVRKDGRGLHDLIAQTKVIMYDKNGKEIQ